MPVEGINGILNVESAALHAPQVGVANTNPQHILSVGSNLYVSGDSPDVLTVDGNVVCEGVKVGLIEITPSYDLEAVANVGNSTSNTIQFTNPDTGIVTTGNVSVGKTLTVEGFRITAQAEANDDLQAITLAGADTNQAIHITNASDSESPYTGALQIGTATDAFGGLGVAGNVHIGRGLFVDGDTLVVDSTNDRVGIGKTNPDATLDVDGNAIIRGDLSVLGTTTTIDTENLRVQDPIIELGKDNAGTGDLGLIMTRPSGSSNVAIIFDENADTLEIGYTDNDASATDITMVSTPLSVNINGDLSVTSNLEVGTANLFVDTVNSRVGVGTVSPIGLLSIVRDTIVADVNTYQRGMFYKDGKLQITPPDLYNGYPLDGDFLTTSRYETDGSTDYTAAALGVAFDTVSGSKSALYFKTASSASSCNEKMRITGDGNVGIGTTNPTRNLHVFHPTYGIHRSIYWSEKPENPATENPIQMGYLGSSDPAHASGAIGLFQNTYEGGTEREEVRIQANGNSWFKGGNVGIGNGNPQTRLDIFDTGGCTMRLTTDSATPQGTIDIIRGDNSRSPNDYTFGASNYYDWRIGSDDTTSYSFAIRRKGGGLDTKCLLIDGTSGNITINGTISYNTKQTTHDKYGGDTYTNADQGFTLKSVTISTTGIAHVHVTGLVRLTALDGTNGIDTDAFYFNIRRNDTEVTASSVGYRIAKLGNANDTDQWKPVMLSWSGPVTLGDTIKFYGSAIENNIEFNELDLNVLVV
jgi:hypothetical protein